MDTTIQEGDELAPEDGGTEREASAENLDDDEESANSLASRFFVRIANDRVEVRL
jgi:hypothetical protein